MSLLQRCYSPFKKPSAQSKEAFEDSKSTIYNGSSITITSVDSKLKEEAAKLSKVIEIEELEALKIVLQTDSKGIVKSEVRFQYYVRHYLSERRYAVKLVNLLFKIRSFREEEERALLNGGDEDISSSSSSDPPSVGEIEATWRKYSTDILVRESFFPELVDQISRNFLSEFVTPSDNSVGRLNSEVSI